MLCSLCAACVCSPVAPNSVKRAVVHNPVINDAAAAAISSVSKCYSDDVSISYADACVLAAGVPGKFINGTLLYYLEAACISISIRIGAQNLVLALDTCRQIYRATMDLWSSR